MEGKCISIKINNSLFLYPHTQSGWCVNGHHFLGSVSTKAFSSVKKSPRKCLSGHCFHDGSQQEHSLCSYLKNERMLLILSSTKKGKMIFFKDWISIFSWNAFRNSNNADGYKLNINMSLLRVKLHKIIKVISMHV